MKIKILSFLAVVLTGCVSYDLVQTNMFSDENGYVVRIDYGRAEKDHVNYFESPTNGKRMEFKTRLVVEVTLPDGEEFTAWQCMNFLSSGTMYRTDNEEWMLHANGFTCVIYRRTEEDATKYLELYRGILCESPKSDYKPNRKWRQLKKDTKGNWK